MRIRRLQIESSQMARISIQAQMARLSINAPLRRINSIQQQSAQMSVDKENPSLEVDAESLRNNIGLKSPATLTREAASQSVDQIKQTIKKIENNGDYVATLPRSGNPIPQIARNALLSPKPAAPPRGVSDPTVSIKSNPGSLSIDWSMQDLSITWDDYQTPVITIEPKPSVNVVLAQEPYIEFKVVEQAYPPESGRTIDKEV